VERNGPYGRVTKSAAQDRQGDPLASWSPAGDRNELVDGPRAGVAVLERHDDVAALPAEPGSSHARRANVGGAAGSDERCPRPTLPELDRSDEDAHASAGDGEGTRADRDAVRRGNESRPSPPGALTSAPGEAEDEGRNGEAAHGASLTGRGGDVDANGDIVDELVQRLRRAVGPFIADDVDADDQVASVLGLLKAGGR
jgi:hypothetical protein